MRVLVRRVVGAMVAMVLVVAGNTAVHAAPGNSGAARDLRVAEVTVSYPDPVVTTDGDGSVLQVEPRGSHGLRVTVGPTPVSFLHGWGTVDGLALWEPREAPLPMVQELGVDLNFASDAQSPRVSGKVHGQLAEGVVWKGRVTGEGTCEEGVCAISMLQQGRLSGVGGEGNCGTIRLRGSATFVPGEHPTWTFDDGAGDIELRDREGCVLIPDDPGAEPEPEPDPFPEWTGSRTVRGDGDNGYAPPGFGGGNPVPDVEGDGMVMCYTTPSSPLTDGSPAVFVSRVDSEDQLATVHNPAGEQEQLLTGLSAVGTLPLDACSLTRRPDGALVLLALDVGVRYQSPPVVRVFVDPEGQGDSFEEQASAYDQPTQTGSGSFAGARIGVPFVEGDTILVPGMLPRTDISIPGSFPMLLRSDDGGQSWSHTQLTTSRYYGGFRGIARFSNGLFAVLTNTYGGITPQLWRSADDGVSWEHQVNYERRAILDGRGASLFSSGGHDPYNYLVFHNNAGSGHEDTDRTTHFRVYRLDATAALPLDAAAFTRGTADAPRGLEDDATWEWIGGPMGDDGYETISVLPTGTVALWGTTKFGGGSKVHAYLGVMPGDNVNIE